MSESETGAIGSKMVQHPDNGVPFLGLVYPNDEARVVSLAFNDYCFPDRQELASSLISRYAVDCDKRPQLIINGHDVNEGEWTYKIVVTSFVDHGGGIDRHGNFQIDGVVVGGYHGSWHIGHHLRASYNFANYDDVTLGNGTKWHFNNELAIYVPVDVASRVDCPGHPDHAPLGNEPGAHELCTYCGGKAKIDLSQALTHSGYSNLRQERLPSM